MPVVLISSLMTRDPIAVRDDAPVETAGALMLRRHFRHLPVIDADGRVVGLADDAAVFARGEWVRGQWFVHDHRDRGLRVSDVARAAPIVLRADDPLSAAVEPMVRTGEDAAVIVDHDRRPIGILTAHDVVKASPSLLPRELDTRTLGRSAVLTVSRQQPVGAALDTMRAHVVRHLVVVDGERPWAVVSWRELQELDAEQRRSAKLTTLRPAAVETVPDGASLREVAERMVVQKVGCLPIVDVTGRLVGIVSRSDLLSLILERA